MTGLALLERLPSLSRNRSVDDRDRGTPTPGVTGLALLGVRSSGMVKTAPLSDMMAIPSRDMVLGVRLEPPGVRASVLYLSRLSDRSEPWVYPSPTLTAPTCSSGVDGLRFRAPAGAEATEATLTLPPWSSSEPFHRASPFVAASVTFPGGQVST